MASGSWRKPDVARAMWRGRPRPRFWKIKGQPNRLAFFLLTKQLPVAAYWHVVNASVAAVALVPGVAVSGVLVEVELVCISDGLQSGVLVPSVRNACASIV